MPVASGTDWRKEFGLSDFAPPAFLPSAAAIDEVGDKVPQSHSLRQAFDTLGLDGILCQNNASLGYFTPSAYFKEVNKIVPAEVVDLHKRFWNQGLSPLLVLIDPTNVHVYSSLSTPAQAGESPDTNERLVVRLNRVADEYQLRQFPLAIQSGELFRQRPKSFDTSKRVDRSLLRNLESAREALTAASSRKRDPRAIDNLLCRLVFTCYLFDRKVIDAEYLRAVGIDGITEIHEILDGSRDEAVDRLYRRLFKKLGEDFNGDLFSDDLNAEAKEITAKHVQILHRLLSGADVKSGQMSFWPYDFSIIPIETISAIYEHFLKASDPEAQKQKGAFYTPRFLAEIVLDLALDGMPRLLEKRYMDPACGSGIFLVGLFNRLAAVWSRKNPGAAYTERVKALLSILKNNLFAVDENPTACRIAAFSLYLALLDQLKPTQIREFQKKGRFLPRLFFDGTETERDTGETIFCGDFFNLPAPVEGQRFHVVVGNPPWAKIGTREKAAAEKWCEEKKHPIANRQLALAFVWKAAEHLDTKYNDGDVCFVLPNGVLFNHQEKALNFQREWLQRHTVEKVLNLSDYQRFLFAEAEFPAIVVRYRAGKPDLQKHQVDYLSPKTDWNVSRTELISVAPEDRTEITVKELLAELKDESAPNPWKIRYWATPRDQKLLDRMGLFPRLSEITRQMKEKSEKPWIAAQGFQPEKSGKKREGSKKRPWDDKQLFLPADSAAIDLFTIANDAEELNDRFPWLFRLPTANEIFEAPHVLVKKGFISGVAYCDYRVVFRHALRGIHGPEEDRTLLKFLAGYLCSPLARYFLFHTTSSWGVYVAEVHVEELLMIPFPLPEETLDPKRAQAIVAQVAKLIDEAMKEAAELLVDREGVVRATRKKITPLIYEYFDIDDNEQMLIEDTDNIIIPSTRPSAASDKVPTLMHPTSKERDEYVRVLCATLNDWAKGGRYHIEGRAFVSAWSGVGVAELTKVNGKPKVNGKKPLAISDEDHELLDVLDRLRETFSRQLGSVELARGVRVFDQDNIYLFKPLRRRFWTRTAALNDADAIAASILSHSAR